MSGGSAIALDLKMALDPVRWALEVAGVRLDDWQQEVIRSDAREVALLCYRQAGKSTVTAIKAAHHLLYFERPFVVVVAPSRRQSDELREKIVRYLAGLPERIAGVRRQSEDKGVELANGARLLCVPDNPEASRGFSDVSMLICEEAAYVSDQLMAAAEPYLSARAGQLVKLSTAAGKRGHFWESMTSVGSSAVDRHTVRWSAEASRISADFVHGYRRRHGEHLYRQEYLCEFLDYEFSVVSRDVVGEAVDERFRGLDV
jgi:hypothetical protein